MASNAEKAIEIFKTVVGKPGAAGRVVPDHAGSHQPVRGLHARPPVHPRRSGEVGAAVALQGDHRARLPHAVDAHPSRDQHSQRDPEAYAGILMGVNYGSRQGALRERRQGRRADPHAAQARRRAAQGHQQRAAHPRVHRSRSRARPSLACVAMWITMLSLCLSSCDRGGRGERVRAAGARRVRFVSVVDSSRGRS